MLAAHATGRSARALEEDARHCDTTVSLWQELTGIDAVLAETGQSFAEVKCDREI